MSNGNSVIAYAPGGNGNVAPIARAASEQRAGYALGDRAGPKGRIYVASFEGGLGGIGAVSVYRGRMTATRRQSRPSRGRAPGLITPSASQWTRAERFMWRTSSMGVGPGVLRFIPPAAMATWHRLPRLSAATPGSITPAVSRWIRTAGSMRRTGEAATLARAVSRSIRPAATAT